MAQLMTAANRASSLMGLVTTRRIQSFLELKIQPLIAQMIQL